MEKEENETELKKDTSKNYIMKLEIKILAFNINGLVNKILFNDFFDYLKQHDIILLYETWVEEKDINKYEKFFGGFELFWVPGEQVEG